MFSAKKINFINQPIMKKQIDKKSSLSDNACSVPHYTVFYWLSIDRGSLPVTDFIGEFIIIDPAFQLETYGNFLHSDLSFLENYAVRRIFFDIENHLPAHLENVPHSFSVLNKCHVVSTHDTVFNCRCHFNSADDLFIPNIDFDISLTVVRGKQKERTKK